MTIQGDFPTAWEIIRKTNPEHHHEKCSYRQTAGGMLCDCAAIVSFCETIELGREVDSRTLISKIISIVEDNRDPDWSKVQKVKGVLLGVNP